MNKEQLINEFIRDVCSVVPMPKSEVRRRLNQILEEERKENERIREMIKTDYVGIIKEQREELKEKMKATIRDWYENRNADLSELPDLLDKVIKLIDK